MRISRVAAVVVTFNRKSLLLQCLSALQAQAYPCDILIVDNASTDGTEDALRPILNSQILYRNTGANLGGAGGFHYGMRWAVEAGYDYVWIMDDDCISNPHTLKYLMDADEILGGNYGFLSSVVLWTDGKECAMNRQKIKKTFYDYLHVMPQGIVQIEQATFVSLLFPSRMIRRFGLPIKEYFIWGDDIEYTRRIALRGNIPSFLVGKSVVTHAMSSNNGSDIAVDPVERLPRYRLAYRNEANTYRKQGLKGRLLYLLRCGRGFYRITFYAKDHRLRRYGALLSGFFSGILFRPEVEYVREETQ